jgi:hypothetical protein
MPHNETTFYEMKPISSEISNDDAPPLNAVARHETRRSWGGFLPADPAWSDE